MAAWAIDFPTASLGNLAQLPKLIFKGLLVRYGDLYSKTTDEAKMRAAVVTIEYTMAIAAAAFAIVFLICWTIGWILSGFAKSPYTRTDATQQITA